MKQKPSHGFVIPLFSLRTQQSCGIGEFLDLVPLIHWCNQIGLDLIQLLPIQDTGDEASPYYPLSSCALDPIYLSLASLPSSLPWVCCITFEAEASSPQTPIFQAA